LNTGNIVVTLERTNMLLSRSFDTFELLRVKSNSMPL